MFSLAENKDKVGDCWVDKGRAFHSTWFKGTREGGWKKKHRFAQGGKGRKILASGSIYGRPLTNVLSLRHNMFQFVDQYVQLTFHPLFILSLLHIMTSPCELTLNFSILWKTIWTFPFKNWNDKDFGTGWYL